MNDKQIVVRDRRRQRHFRIENEVFDDWLPILGTLGFSIYSMYNRLASSNDERSYPGYQLIEGFLNISAGTIANYNRLLVWCGLIHVERGDAARNLPNEYFILDPPRLTPSILHEIRQQALAHYDKESFFLQALLERLNNWRPLEAYFPKRDPIAVIKATHNGEWATHNGERPTHIREQGTHIREQAAHTRERPTYDSEQPTHIGRVEQKTNTNNKQTNKKKQEQPTIGWLVGSSILERMGVLEPFKTQIGGKYPADLILATAWWVLGETWAENPAGLLVARLSEGKYPPDGFVELAEFVLALDEDDRAALVRTITPDLALEWELSDAGAAAADTVRKYKHLGGRWLTHFMEV